MSELSRLLRLALLGLMLAVGARALARVPDWLQPHLQSTVEAGPHPAVLLVRSDEVQYLREDRVRRTYRGALRVVNNHGRSRAVATHVINPDLEKILSAQAWVITGDGRKSESFPTSSFADMPLPVGRQVWVQHRMISFAGGERVKPGEVFAWEIQIESKVGIADVQWTCDSDLPIGLTSFEVTPPVGGRIEWHATGSRVPPPVAGRAPGALRWQMEAFMPAKGERPERFLPEPQFVFARAVSAQPGATTRTWGDFARLAADVIEPRLTLSPAVQSRAETLVAGKTDRWERVRALCQWVQRDITYLLISLDRDYLAGYRPHAPDEVLRNRFGDCKDKMALLIALLRSVGEQGWPVLVAAGSPVQVRREWPAAVFNHVMVGIPADEATPKGWPIVDAGALGKLVLFDPTDRVTPLGFLPTPVQGGLGLVASGHATDLIVVPVATAETNRYRSTITGAVDPNGTLVCKVEETWQGALGVAMRQNREQLASEAARQVLEARLREDGLAVRDLKWSDAWDEASAGTTLKVEFSVPRYARRAGGLLVVNPQVLASRARLAPWLTEQPGLAWIAAGGTQKRIRLVLPAGAVVEEMPEDQTIELPGGTGRISYRKDGDVVEYAYDAQHQGGLLERQAYDELRTFFQRMQEAERRPILVRLEAAGAASR